MINTGELIDNLVTLLREIPELVAEMVGDASLISAYHDEYPKRSSLAVAIHQMPVPGILVAWHGILPGSFGGNEVWKHQVKLYMRAGPRSAPAPYYRLFRLITKGVPASMEVPMLNATVHPCFYPMDVPQIERATDAEGLDYFEVPLSFTEIGDE